MLANALKTAAIAALLGLGAAGAASTSASAYTIKTRCFGDDCVRMQCNDFGYDCLRIGRSDRDDYDRVLPYGYERTYEYGPEYVPAHPAPAYTAPGYYDAFGNFHYYNGGDDDYDYDDYDPY